MKNFQNKSSREKPAEKASDFERKGAADQKTMVCLSNGARKSRLLMATKAWPRKWNKNHQKPLRIKIATLHRPQHILETRPSTKSDLELEGAADQKATISC